MLHLPLLGRINALPRFNTRQYCSARLLPVFALLLAMLLTSCSMRQQQVNQLAASLNHADPAQVLSQLEQSDPPERDFALHHLDIGMLQFLNGDFTGAINSLTKAKQKMAALEASSVTENISAATVNETLRSYSGSPTDRVMVHTILALSYLFNQDISGARVEILQANVMMKKLASNDSLTGQLTSAHLVSAMIYELSGEKSNAFISYKIAFELSQQHKIPVATGIKQALLRLSYQLGVLDQYQQYQKQFGIDYKSNNTNSQVFALYLDGVISTKIQKSVTVPHHDQFIRIAMPAYPPSKYRASHASIGNSNTVTTELIENLEPIVREDLSQDYASILLLTTTRAIAKYNLVQEAQKQSGLFGALLNIATMLIESADVRSWNMLPSTIQFTYLETAENTINVSNNKIHNKPITLAEKSQQLILMTSLTDKVFKYQQASME